MTFRYLPLMGMLWLCSNTIMAQSENWTSARPDGHAPIGVMGDHYHAKGGLMLSYRYMYMGMEGNLNGTSDASNEDIYQNYMIAPQEMSMEMHMIGAMYGLSDRVTLMAMANYQNKSMDLRIKNGTVFNTASGGFGDVTVSGLIKVFNKNRQSLHGIVGLSIPTGDIDQMDQNPMDKTIQLAYPMQLGSGTFDPFLGATFLGQGDLFSYGAQLRYRFRGGENEAEYTLGNRLTAKAWGAVKMTDWASLSVGLDYLDLGSTEGADPDMNPGLMPLFDTDNSGKSRADLKAGLNLLIPEGKFNNLRLGLEFGAPVYQETQGFQMKSKWMGTVGLQYML